MKGQEVIHLTDVLNLIDGAEREGKPIPFSITYVTFNRRTGEGGEIKCIEQAIKPTGRKGTRMPGESKKAQLHRYHATRNFQILGTPEIRKVHIRLILEYNSKKVVW